MNTRVQYKPNYLSFSHRRLTKKAKEYMHEISHLTSDMLVIIRKANINFAICEKVVKVLGSRKQTFRIATFTEIEDFFDLVYNIENFIFRVSAFRDKYCMFLNQVFKFGYPESE